MFIENNTFRKLRTTNGNRVDFHHFLIEFRMFPSLSENNRKPPTILDRQNAAKTNPRLTVKELCILIDSATRET